MTGSAPSPSRIPGFLTPVRIACAIPLLVAVAYAPTLGAFFQSDDFFLIEAVSVGGPFGIWTTDSFFFRPLTTASLYLDWLLFERTASGYHATSLLLHAANALLVGWIAARIASPTRVDPLAGFFGAALFAVLPSHSEAVCWIAARSDLLATFGGLAATAAFIAYRRSHRSALLGVAWACFGAGLLAKESILLLPGILLALDVAVLGARAREALARASFFAGIAVAFFGVRAAMIGAWIGGYGASHLDPGNVLANLVYFPFRALLPPLSSGAFLAASLAIALGVVALATQRVRSGERARIGRWIAFAIALVLALAPVLPLAVGRGTVEHERFLYGPSAVLCIGIATACFRREWRASRWLAGGILAAMALATWLSAATWATASQLCQRTVVAVTSLPESRRVYVGPLRDSREGAYVFRNGFDAAIRLFERDGVRREVVAAPFRWNQRKARYRMSVAVADGGRVLTATNDGGGFVATGATPDVEVLEHARASVTLAFPEAGAADWLVIAESDGIRFCRPEVDCT